MSLIGANLMDLIDKESESADDASQEKDASHLFVKERHSSLIGPTYGSGLDLLTKETRTNN